MRKFFLAAVALMALSCTAPAFAGDVTIEHSGLNATSTGMAGKQTATATGKHSIAQTGAASVESAGTATVKVSYSKVNLTGGVSGNGTNTATATGDFSTAQAGVASIQGADNCNCGQ